MAKSSNHCPDPKFFLSVSIKTRDPMSGRVDSFLQRDSDIPMISGKVDQNTVKKINELLRLLKEDLKARYEKLEGCKKIWKKNGVLTKPWG